MSDPVEFAPGWQNGLRPKFPVGTLSGCACGHSDWGWRIKAHRDSCATYAAWLLTVPPPPPKENPDLPRICSVWSGLNRAINAPTKRETDILLIATRDFILAAKKAGEQPVMVREKEQP